MKISNRVEQLRKNFRRMFGVQVFLNLHFLNVVTTIFYLHRGLSMVQIFYLGVAFSVINLIFEVPSSYLADKWGRKNTIILGCVFMLFQKIIYFSADSFFGMVSAIGCYALAYALFTGTDEALIYDTARELGEDQKTLTRLGSYFSAQRFAKILSPIIGAVIANNLLDWQFQVVIGLDALTVLVGFILATQLIEPYHRTDVEKQQSGVFRDAVALVSRNTYLLRLLLNKTLIFSASFVIWRMHQQFFIDRGVSLITLGVIVGLGQGIAYLGGKNINKIFPHHTLAARINFLNYIFTAFIILFTFATWIYPNIWVLLITYVGFIFIEPVRWVFYSELMNKRAHSFNRATSLSVANLVKSVMDVPLLLIGAYLVSISDLHLFVFSTAIAVFAAFGLKMHDEKTV